MERKEPLRIAVVGMDGTGKSTVIKSMKNRFNGETKLGYLKTLPRADKYYKSTNRVQKMLQNIALKGDEKKEKFMVMLPQIAQNMLYPFIRISMEKNKDIMIYERHPHIDYTVYGPEYGGTLATKLGRFLSGTPYPDIIIHIDGNPEKAYDRILSRVGPDQRKRVPHIHETLEGLTRVRKRFGTVIRDIVKKRPKTKVINLDSEKSRKEMLADLHGQLDGLGL